MNRKPVTDRFWQKVRIAGPNECWIWTAAIFDDRGGYGAFRIDDATLRAHRVAWSFKHGPIPNGMDVLHRCDNPPCVNDAHLFLGTNADNMADRDRKGRVCHGENHSCAKLTPVQVDAILASPALPVGVLAVLYGVAHSTISRIRHGRAWRRAA